MTFERPALERRILTALDAIPSRIPVLVGACGSGRTQLLHRVAALQGSGATQYVDVERAASTPEGFYASVTRHSPFTLRHEAVTPHAVHDGRAAFDALYAVWGGAQTSDGRPAVFLIDEFIELRTFESFPGLRSVVRELVDLLTSSPNRFVLTTRFVHRAHRVLRDAPSRFEVIHVPPLSPDEVSTTLDVLGVGRDSAERADLSRMVHALTDGRPVYVRAVAEQLARMEGPSRGDPVSALASALSVHAHLCLICRFTYELRLHRARGYGALKAILQVLAEDESLTLTEIAHRLGRTPGSTKDYLTWLEDVDLISVRQKRYSFGDPLLRLWVRLHCRPEPPTETDLAREVQEYAVSRLPYMEPVSAVAGSGQRRVGGGEANLRKEDEAWSIIEID